MSRRVIGGGRESPRIILIAGQCSGVGKTALGVDIIRGFPEQDWLALKITRHHTEQIAGGAGYAFQAESDREGKSDTSRYLAAGANRSFLIEIRAGYLAVAMREIKQLIAGAQAVLIEGNSALGYLRPSLTLLVLDPRRRDFKPSAREALGQAAAVVLRFPMFGEPWRGIESTQIVASPVYLQPFGKPLGAGLRRFIGNTLNS
ncbi:MAG TPA: hypothetical protein VGR81_13435 [Candidatus Acidoferrales bacterium]|nr:hypothetical protein [Candidatus Acidoferrales bacterium]